MTSSAMSIPPPLPPSPISTPKEEESPSLPPPPPELFENHKPSEEKPIIQTPSYPTSTISSPPTVDVRTTSLPPPAVSVPPPQKPKVVSTPQVIWFTFYSSFII